MKYELPPNNRDCSDEILLQDLRRMAAHGGRNTVTRDEYEACGRCHPKTLVKRFGSWNEALRTAGLVTTKGFPPYTGKWKEIRDLRVLCTGHPVDKGEAKKQPAVRTFAGRHFGNYNEVTLESYREDRRNTEHPKIMFAVLIDAYAREAVDFLEQAETEMKRRWP